MSQILKAISFLLLMCSAHLLPAQFKYEREIRLQEAKVPIQALSFLDSNLPMKKLKWYYEESLQDNSVEAKFQLLDKRYSVEFDTLGNLQDIEVQINPEEIPTDALKGIQSQLSKDFDRFKLRKIQIQYLGENLDWSHLYPSVNLPASITKNYEIVVKGRKDRATKLYEYLFDKDGRKLERKEIIFRNTDNLEY